MARLPLNGWSLINSIAVTVGLFVLVLGWQEFYSQKVLALLPWLLLLLIGRSGWAALCLVVRQLPVVSWATLGLSAWVFFGQSFAGFQKADVRQALSYLVWIPVAALLVQRFQVNKYEKDYLPYGLLIAQLISLIALSHDVVTEPLVRPNGLNQNVLSGSLGLLQGLVFAQLMLVPTKKRPPHMRVLLVFSLMLGLMIAVVTSARSPLIAFTVGGVLAFVMTRARVRWTVFLALLVVGLVWLSMLWERFIVIASEAAAYLQGERLSSVGGRLDAWRWSAEHFFERPWFGWNVDGLKAALAERSVVWGISDAQYLVDLPHLHNDVMQVRFAHGIPAGILLIVVLLGFCYFVLRRLACAKPVNPRLRLHAAFFLWTCFAIILAGQVDSLFYWSPVAIAFQTLLGISVAAFLTHWQQSTQTS